MNLEDNVFSVSEINMHLKNVLENNIPPLMVQGEISNYKFHSSGHIYFSLKDSQSSIRGVFFRYNNQSLTFSPKNGDSVICTGRITIYERAGNYQLLVDRMYPEGTGILQMKFEELKKKLSNEGLFDEIHKKSIVRHPKSIGIVTSETGAALQDILDVINRRYPTELFVYPSIVQGKSAPKTLIEGIRFFNENIVDTIIIGRGGGSQEDLFCFNDESLARAIFASKVPVIAGIGHEIDFTISDFVADLRAPTPSAAAELAVPSREEVSNRLLEKLQIIEYFSLRKLKEMKDRTNLLYRLLIENHPKNKILKFRSNCKNLSTRFVHSFLIIDKYKDRVNNLEKSLISNMTVSFNQEKNKIQRAIEKNNVSLTSITQKKIQAMKEAVTNYNSMLEELSPQKALERGYAILRKDKKIKKSVLGLSKDDLIDIVLSDGEVNCKVEKVTNK
ncbi:MAG: exodeoxyribonuclease VII large subunit [Candidatus Cloacimonadota bacterium]|nr:exodeoxyribonuclease VII large subunit [Candidatus Cloacimonadota bacterium]